jgi:hypothetical protein
MEVFSGVGHILRGGVLQPAQGGIVVVGAHVGHAVTGIAVGQIDRPAAVPAVKGELQDLHAGKARVLPEPVDGGRQKAQILRKNGPGPQGRFYRLKEPQAGPLPPAPFLSGRRPVGDGIIGVEPPKMVDAQYVINSALVVDAPYPPPEAVGLHEIPVKEGVAPELAVRGEAVGGTACHLDGLARPVQLELFRLGPYVHTVPRDVDGQVANEAHTAPAGVGF